MARFSQPSGQRFFAWSDGTDNYNHSQLAANLDAIDALFGWPPSGVWPTAGNSMYSYITALQASILPLGTIIPFVRFDATSPLPGASLSQTGLSGTPTTSGLVVLDGSTVTAANHSFTNGVGVALGDIVLPDLRNAMLMGANISLPDGAASTSGTDPTNAPGILGRGGSMALATHTHTVPNHYHRHDHIHEVGNVTHGLVESGPAADGIINITPGSSPGVSASHHHHIDLYSSVPRVEDNADYKVSDAPNSNSTVAKTQTSLQKLSSGGTTDIPTGGNAGDAINLTIDQDVRPAHLGVLYLLKCKVTTAS